MVDARDVEHAEVRWARRWIRAQSTAVTKLNAKSYGLKRNRVEKATIPALQPEFK
jgi:hypothetical protein